MNPVEVTEDYVLSTALRRWGVSLKRNGHEWHGSCFQCGGEDRFMVFSNGGFYCRQCEVKGWLDDDQKKFKIDPLLLIQQAERVKLEREQRGRRWIDWCNGFAAGYFWREWHDKMTPENREWWHRQGISDHAIDYYELGYLAEKRIKLNEKAKHGDYMVLPAYTIPVRDLESWDIVGMHYRLVDPPDYVGGKYRYESDIPAREFYASPGLKDKGIVLEGAKKAMVVYDHIDAACQVIGLPGCTPSEEVMDRIKANFSQVWLALDPGCEKQEQRFKSFVPQTRVVHLPEKPDDFLLGGASVAQFREYLRLAK